VVGLELLPALQRVFLSHNALESLAQVQCLFSIAFLIELSLDGNPIALPDTYRHSIISVRYHR
jgi:Leucine-rich repeat (LRR) protein